MTKLWAQALIKSKKPGVAINISSICAEIGAINPAYAASKAAINAMTISFAKALAPHSIRVNAIAPGPIETAMGNKIPQDRQAEFIKRIALGRFGLPQEIAAVAAFLAGEDASYITGAVIPVDGGFI